MSARNVKIPTAPQRRPRRGRRPAGAGRRGALPASLSLCSASRGSPRATRGTRLTCGPVAAPDTQAKHLTFTQTPSSTPPRRSDVHPPSSGAPHPGQGAAGRRAPAGRPPPLQSRGSCAWSALNPLTHTGERNSPSQPPPRRGPQHGKGPTDTDLWLAGNTGTPVLKQRAGKRLSPPHQGNTKKEHSEIGKLQKNKIKVTQVFVYRLRLLRSGNSTY